MKNPVSRRFLATPSLSENEINSKSVEVICKDTF